MEKIDREQLFYPLKNVNNRYQNKLTSAQAKECCISWSLQLGYRTPWHRTQHMLKKCMDSEKDFTN